MPRQKTGWAVGIALPAALAFVALSNSGVARPAQDKKPNLADATFYGVSSCKDCHNGKNSSWPTDLAPMNEFVTWITKDKHALAYAVLKGDRGAQMAKVLKLDVATSPQCLNCHATTSRPERHGEDFKIYDGVSCDGCHGPAQNWMLPHAFKRDSWRLKSPQEKEDLGMFDVRNPVKRAQMCMSCHVGNAAEGKVVTHAMYAAGHPPLPGFEVASYSKNLPQHWYDAKDAKFFKSADAKVRKQNYADDAEYQNTKLVLASCSEALRTMSELIANRATLTGKPRDPGMLWPPAWLRPVTRNLPADRWPELAKPGAEPSVEQLEPLWFEIAMAQADCYACHHDLKAKSWRQLRGYSGRPGQPHFAAWPFVLAPAALSNGSEFSAKRKALAAALDVQPFGVPKSVAACSLDLAAFADQMPKATDTVTRETAEKLLKSILSQGTSTLRDCDSARQIAWAAHAVFGDLSAHHPQAQEIHALFKKLDDELNLTLDSQARKTFVDKRYLLTKGFADLANKDYEKTLLSPLFLKSLSDVSDAELVSALARTNEYEPELFRRRIQELQRLVGSK